MSQWYVKDLSQLTGVSIQTLHHYDRISLLKPSVRLPNGYRLYSEKDLLKLQQIIALKFFGFHLTDIKKLLLTEDQVLHHFSLQAQFLEEKANHLHEASQALKKIVSEFSNHQSIPWKTIIQLIEVYRMTEELEKTWAGKVFTPTELKEYAQFEQHLKTRFTEKEKKEYTEAWRCLVEEVENHLNDDPRSETGISLGQRCMDWVNHLYGKQYVKLRKAIWEKGFKEGNIDRQYPLSQKGVAWLDKAISAYYRSRLANIIDQAGKQADVILIKKWNELLTDMCGDEESLKKEIVQAILEDNTFDSVTKQWLKKINKK